METDRRIGDRRVRRVSLYYPERRHGFDRRHPGGGPLRTAHYHLMLSLRARPRLVAAALAGVVTLNAADLALTLQALSRGASELNPVMAGLIGFDPVVAGFFKLVLVTAVAAGLWVWREYRRVLEASLLLLAGFTLLSAYHTVGLLAL